ncbi:MAG: Peptide-methionine (S)-S-oxide reductase [Candelina mexicana]|nr:MAG: Peptide-methionine (S)-S-oxide reductase [Candelina mexicana]
MTTSQLPTFLTRLFRPFTTSTRLSLNPSDTTTPQSLPANAQKATVAAGCFWGVEHLYRKHFDGKGLLDAKVGYIGGDTRSPSYRSVCSGRTGHAEALQVTFDPAQVSYRTLIEFFYKMHDPTEKNRQGGDVGTQYRSAIFTHDDEQMGVARDVTEKVQKQWWKNKTIETEIVPAGEWWDAERYHQLYLHNNPGGYECPAHYVRGFGELE